MSISFIEVPARIVQSDLRFPDMDTKYIYEHLRHASRNWLNLPVIDVVVLEGHLIVTRGHKFLAVAIEQQRPLIRAIYRSSLKEPAGILSELPKGAKLIAKELLERESRVLVDRDWHTYFFESPLSLPEQKLFLTDIVGFFTRLETPLISTTETRVFKWGFPFDGLCGEFEAMIPLSDQSWLEQYLDLCRKFSREVRRIVSFQGARFPS